VTQQMERSLGGGPGVLGLSPSSEYFVIDAPRRCARTAAERWTSASRVPQSPPTMTVQLARPPTSRRRPIKTRPDLLVSAQP